MADKPPATLDDVMARLAAMQKQLTELSTLKADVKHVDAHLGALERKVDSMDGRVSRRMDALEGSVKTLRSDMWVWATGRASHGGVSDPALLQLARPAPPVMSCAAQVRLHERWTWYK